MESATNLQDLCDRVEFCVRRVNVRWNSMIQSGRLEGGNTSQFVEGMDRIVSESGKITRTQPPVQNEFIGAFGGSRRR